MERKGREEPGEEMIREGHVVIDEDLVDAGHVTYVGTTGEAPVADPMTRPPVVAPVTTGDRPTAPLATTGAMTDPVESQIINQVREGMRVVDVTGEDLGTVELVQMGDPEAVTVQDDALHEPGDVIRDVFGVGEPDVPEPLRSRLLRSGYVKIDGPGWIDTDRYVTADVIGGITGETVTLTVAKDHLLTEM